MFTEIILQTPKWVFALFFGLLLLGYRQSKPRIANKNTLLIIPIVMVSLSISGELATFNLQLSALLTWFVGVGFAWLMVTQFTAIKGRYLVDKKLFELSGSWLPAILMLAIFFTKYAVGVLLATQAAIITSTEFMLVVSLLYGSFSGAFAARAHKTWQLKNTTAIPL